MDIKINTMYSCGVCGCDINEGEYSTFGVCDPCFEKNYHERMNPANTIQSLRDQLSAKEKENAELMIGQEQLALDLVRCMDENDAMKAILKELIPIVDWMRKGSVDRGLFANPGSYGKVGAALDKARNLINENR